MANLDTQLTTIIHQLADTRADLIRADAGQVAGGTRARKSLAQVDKLIKQLRKDVLAVRAEAKDAK